MLFVIFHVGDDRYVVDAQKVVEVVPLVKLSNFSNTPEYIAGLCNYRAVPVPVVDIRCLLENIPSKEVMSTRILLVKYTGFSGHEQLLGMIVEYATETIVLDVKRFHQSTLQSSEENYVSNIMTDEKGIIQWMDVDRLLSRHDCDILYGSPAEMIE